MNDQDIIRKGVELAPGWEFYGMTIITDQGDRFPEPYSDACKAALAAVLVDMVDALMSVELQIFCGTTLLTVPAEPEFEVRMPGPDRRMNTLRAIIESGVLEPQSESTT